jgi:hypothetical protein
MGCPSWATPIYAGPKRKDGIVGKEKKKRKIASPAPKKHLMQSEYVSQMNIAKSIALAWQQNLYNYDDDEEEMQNNVRIVGVEVVPAAVRTLVLKHTIVRNLIQRFLDVRFLVSHFTFCVGHGIAPWQLQVDRAHRRRRVAQGSKRIHRRARARQGQRVRRGPRGLCLRSHFQHEAAPQEAHGACGCRVDVSRGGEPRRNHHVGSRSSEAGHQTNDEQLPGHAWQEREQADGADEACMQILSRIRYRGHRAHQDPKLGEVCNEACNEAEAEAEAEEEDSEESEGRV